MTTRFAYDRGLEPPAPVVPVRISGPDGEDALVTTMLVDTGADCTLVSVALARRLGLPRIDVVTVSGVGGARKQASVHAAVVELGKLRLLIRAVAFAEEAILGRDVLNQIRVVLDGPGLEIAVTRRSNRKRQTQGIADSEPGPPQQRRRSRKITRGTRAAIEQR
jgi:predicted aspartyl protease